VVPSWLKIYQVGGSIAGLMHGIVLKSLGHNVHILEAREPQEMEAETAGLSLAVEAQQLMKAYLPEVKDYAMPPAPAIQVVDTHGEILVELPIRFSSITSTWGVVFQHLRDRFLQQDGNSGISKFELRKRVLDVTDDGKVIMVMYQDNDQDSVNIIQADLVIAADGSNSTIRKKVLPNIESKSAGYVAWRGYVSESVIPETMKGLFDDKLIMTQFKNGYLLA